MRLHRVPSQNLYRLSCLRLIFTVAVPGQHPLSTLPGVQHFSSYTSPIVSPRRQLPLFEDSLTFGAAAVTASAAGEQVSPTL